MGTETWTVIKRDGREVPFDSHKIRTVVYRCLTQGLKRPKVEADPIADHICMRTVNGIAGSGQEHLGVEQIQQWIISQLWSEGQYQAAEQFTLYREARRKDREANVRSADYARLIEADSVHFPSPLQYFQFIDKYARWRETDRRRETWAECCARVMGFLSSRPKLKDTVDQETWTTLKRSMYEMKASPAMRVVQMAGPALERCNAGAFNCSYSVCDSLQTFPEALYLLMSGCGVGFSVESDYVDELPRVKKHKRGHIVHHWIDDSTEGWCEAYRVGLETWFDGGDVEYDYSGIRPAGAILKIKGGRSSGPDCLRRLLEFARQVILKRAGKYLTPLDCHYLMCMTGKIVQMGGVRRASEISLSDLNDHELRHAKSGPWWQNAPWLDMANNSAVYNETPSSIDFMREWLALAESGSGERGIFNRAGVYNHIPKRRNRKHKFGCNPCGEILLRPFGFCNLSIAVARHNDDAGNLLDKVRVAAIFGTLQATLTDFQYLRPIWKHNADEEALLGVDVTGQMDCPVLRPNAPYRTQLLKDLKEEVLKTNAHWAPRVGINISAASTTVKPGGNSAAFFACSSGQSCRWSKYQVRRVRLGKGTPVARLLIDQGVPYAPDPLNDTLYVFDFLPDPAPDGTPTRNDLTAIQQFHNWLEWKENYTEHNPSVTIYVSEDEWLALGHEVYKNFDRVGGLSFLPKDGGTYSLAPNEELTQEEYEKRRAAFPVIDWSKLVRYEDQDYTDQRAEPACAGGACET